MSCNSCCNSLHESLEDRIFRIVENSEIELSPIQVTSGLRKTSPDSKVNHSTVRSLLRRLLAKGKISQPYPGFYCSQIMYGVRFVPLRVHNVVLVSEGVCWCDFHDELEERTGDVVVKVCFGKERRKVVVRLCCDVPGMDRDTLLFALSRAYDLVRARSGGRVLESVRFVTLETNRDFSGVKLEGGFKVYTLPSLNNVVERIYQKEDNLVRHELKVSEKMTVDQFLELAHGGVSTYNVAQTTFHLTQKVEGLTEAVKTLVGFVDKNQKVQDAILDRLYRLNEKPWRTGENE